MGNESILRSLRAKVKDLETKKRDLDNEVASLHIAIRVFERNEQSQASTKIPSLKGLALYMISYMMRADHFTARIFMVASRSRASMSVARSR